MKSGAGLAAVVPGERRISVLRGFGDDDRRLQGADDISAFNADLFWNYRATCELTGARYPAAPLGLITVAALLPQSWEVRLVNRNTESLTEADLEWADLVMTGGMLFQQPDSLRIIEMCRALGKPVVVGGPDVTSTPGIYRSANFRVLGEAEEIMEDFVAAWRSGAEEGVFEAPMGQTDVTRSPTPRFDLLKLEHYLHVGIQFSRGCPFNCEFCDIIELYGRVPRTKTNEQVLAELDALYALGYRGHIDFVDDNLIGNKKALKKFLPDLQRWLTRKNFPFEFSTEASINLADDSELLSALAAANFFGIFVGIESPDTDTLVLMRKKQNTRRSLQESIHKIYNSGIFVFAGFIVGFDSEKGNTAEGMIGCIEDTAIPVCTVGLLYALPTTQLGRRLCARGASFPVLTRPARRIRAINARSASTSKQSARAATCSRITARCWTRSMNRLPISAACAVSAACSDAGSPDSRHRCRKRCATCACWAGWFGAYPTRAPGQRGNSGRVCSTAPSTTRGPCVLW